MNDREMLKELSDRLRTPGLPTQVELARGAEVDQPLVSRARKDQLTRVTERVQRLKAYVDMRIGKLPKSSGRKGVASSMPADDANAREAARRCNDFLLNGGDPNLLLDQLALLSRAQGMPHR